MYNEKEIKEQAIANMKIGVDKVISGEEQMFKTDLVSAMELDNYIKTIGARDADDWLDTNGWQCDFWLYYVINEERYYVSGSGLYGGLSFQKDEDEN